MVIIAGLVSGAAGTALLFWFFPGFRQAQIPPGSQAIIVQQPGRVVVEEGTRIQDIRDNASVFIGGIFHSKDAVAVDSTTTIFPEGKRIGYGVLLTNDGWFGTTSASGMKVGDSIVIGGKPYAIDKVIGDPASDFLLGKVTSATSFPVATFLPDANVSQGMTIVAVGADGNVYRTTLWGKPEPTNPAVVSVSSDSVDTAYRLVDVAGFPPGTPFFDLSGSLLGLTDKNQAGQLSVIPAAPLNSLLNSVLTSGKATRSSLGIRYVPITSANDTSRWSALVYSEDATTAVKASGSAGKAHLKAGDVITQIGNTPLSTSYPSLFSALQQYAPGTAISVQYLRGGQSTTTTIVVGSSGG